MGKNKSKKVPPTEYQKFESAMSKLRYKLKKEEEERFKRKKENHK